MTSYKPRSPRPWRRWIPVAAALIPALAGAQDLPIDTAPELNAQLFRHSVDSERTLWADDAGLIRDGFAGNLRLATNYMDDPFVVAYGDEISKLVDYAWQVNLLGAIQYDRVRLGVDLPAYITSGGALSAGGGGLSDIGASLRLTLVDRLNSPVGAALSVRTALPTSTVDAPVGASLEWEVQGILDTEIDRVLLTLNAGYKGIPDTAVTNVVWGDQLAFRAGGGYAFTEVTALSAELAFSSSVSNWGAENAIGSAGAAVPVEGILGLHQRVSTDWRIQVGAGKGLSAGIGSPTYRLIAALEWRPPHQLREGRQRSDGPSPEEQAPQTPAR